MAPLLVSGNIIPFLSSSLLKADIANLSLALARPDAITAIVSQNGNAFEEGLGDFWAPIRSYWADPSKEKRDNIRFLLTMDLTKLQVITYTSPLYPSDPLRCNSIMAERQTLMQSHLRRTILTRRC